MQYPKQFGDVWNCNAIRLDLLMFIYLFISLEYIRIIEDNDT